jgi:hypothetical protein
MRCHLDGKDKYRRNLTKYKGKDNYIICCKNRSGKFTTNKTGFDYKLFKY